MVEIINIEFRDKPATKRPGNQLEKYEILRDFLSYMNYNFDYIDEMTDFIDARGDIINHYIPGYFLDDDGYECYDENDIGDFIGDLENDYEIPDNIRSQYLTPPLCYMGALVDYIYEHKRNR